MLYDVIIKYDPTIDDDLITDDDPTTDDDLMTRRDQNNQDINYSILIL